MLLLLFSTILILASSLLAPSYTESSDSERLEEPDASENVKRRKLCPADPESAVTINCELSKDELSSSGSTDISVKQTPGLLLVKVTRSGLLLFTFPKDSCLDPVGIVSNITQSIESGDSKRPLLDEKEVSTTVSNLVHKYVNDKSNKVSRPLKFAVGYNRRGIEDTEMKHVKDNSSDPNFCALLDRNKCFSIVAAAVKEIVSDSAVDLKSPELCILIELLPLPVAPKGSLIAAVSVLPRDLVSTKPRLCVRALVADTKAKKEEA